MTSEEVIRNLADTLQEAHSEALRALRELRAQNSVEGMCCDCANGGPCCDYSENMKCDRRREDGSCWTPHKLAKLDRSRWDGCKFCEFPSLGEVTVDSEPMCENANEMHLRRYKGNLFYLVCIGDYGYEYEVPVFNCPWCGRPLTEEAWAELERRISYVS